jgi:Flp pilus assembly protein TadG
LETIIMSSGIFKRNPRAGQTVITVALALVVLLGFVGLAIDVGMMMLARNEVQNAADAAALTGASEFYKFATPPTGSVATPNWTRAQDSATKAVTRNKVMNTALATGTYQTGYWNLTGTPSGMQSTTKNPLLATDRPAIKVTIVKAAGSNGGPISLFLAPLVGVSNMQVKASAVAVSSDPGAVDSGQVMPVALNKCLYDNYWDVGTNSPKIDPGTSQPYEFKITNGNKSGPCEGGQWTSFGTGSNGASTIKDFVNYGNPDPLAIGDSTWIDPGVKNSIYKEFTVPSDVFFVVVPSSYDLSSKGWTTIVGFAAFHIDASVGGSGKYIQGHFLTGKILPYSSQGGPGYGAVSPPVLVQ